MCFTGDGGGGVAYSEIVDQDLGTMPPSQIIKRHIQPEKEKEMSKKVPREKYNRVCKENASLLSALEVKTEELRKITAQKMAVERENDELLALLDIQERAKYEKSRSVSSEEEYCTFNSTELAILGACRCRIISPNPCGCAHAAANLKKEVVRYKQEIVQYKNRRDEAFLTVDAYRKAFEEQLERSKVLTLQLANLTTSSATRTSKAREALKWLMRTLNDDDTDYDSDCQSAGGPKMSEHEFITYLIEMLHEKKEVLAHQKLMSQILGDRLKTAEEKLLKYEAKDEVFT